MPPGEKSREDAKTKRFFDVDKGGRRTQVGRAGETFKSQGRDTQGKGHTLGIGDKVTTRDQVQAQNR